MSRMPKAMRAAPSEKSDIPQKTLIEKDGLVDMMHAKDLVVEDALNQIESAHC
jgi:hypothetical protein